MKVILEILVDKKNLKGPGVFEYVLVILHKAFEEFQTKKIFQKQAIMNDTSFSFEITKIGNRIRFFIIVPQKYANFFKNQLYAHYTDVEILEVADYLVKIPEDKLFVGNVKLAKHLLYPINTFTQLQEAGSKDMVDPFSSITGALGRTGKYTLNTFQVNFIPTQDKNWKKDAKKTLEILLSSKPTYIKKLLLSRYLVFFKILGWPFLFLASIFKLLGNPESGSDQESEDSGEDSSTSSDIPQDFLDKISSLGYQTSINIIHAGEDKVEARSSIREVFSTLGVFANFGKNSFQMDTISQKTEVIEQVKSRSVTGDIVLSAAELSGLVHLPTSYVKTPQINWVSARAFEPPSNLPIVDPDLTDDIEQETDLTPIGITNFRGTNMSFGMGSEDRRRHMYILGKTGMGKSTLLENMIIDDIQKGRGVAVIDPHGDLAETVIGFIPKSRTNQTIIFDPSDTQWPIAFNMLEDVSPEHRPLIASGLVGIFKKIFGDSWGPRLEHILRNTILALLEYPNSTLISIPLMLTSEVFRNKVVAKVSDPVVKKFWTGEFAKMAPNQKVEAAGPILNKVGQFLSSSLLRNVLGQPKNSFSIRWAMDQKKIIIVNLSKGKIGEDASSLLGAMMVTKFQLEAMSRADITEKERVDFYLYVDEFQNFATDSFSTILSEARKYKLNLVMANQYIDQMQESVRGAVFGNVGSLVSFQIGYHDATILKEVLSGETVEEDLMNLKKYTIYIKQLIDGMPSPVFSAKTFPPNKKETKKLELRYEKIQKVSREKYAKDKKSVEEKTAKLLNDIEKQEKAWERKKEELKNKQKADRKKQQEQNKGNK